MEQLRLFSNTQVDVTKPKPRYSHRGPYKKHPKIISDWQKMSEAYSLIASYLPVSICNTESYTNDYSGLRLWHTVYSPETYTYNNEICMGENFKTIQAEIIGTEKLNLQDRLKIHLELIEHLRSGQSIEVSIQLIQPLLNNVPKRELGEFALWLRQLRG